MRKLTLYAGLLLLISACSTPDGGYYDANGNWIAYNRYSKGSVHPPLPGGPHKPEQLDRYGPHTYMNRGFYDENADYFSSVDGLNIPEDMFPEIGMCRVWFPERGPEYQPPIKPCKEIKSPIPAGSYVVSGGGSS
jgi:hypothetical protein